MWVQRRGLALRQHPKQCHETGPRLGTTSHWHSLLVGTSLWFVVVAAAVVVVHAQTKKRIPRIILILPIGVSHICWACQGALFVIVDIVGSKERRKRVYCQIVLGLSIADLITAIPWLISTAAIPAYVDGGDPSGVLGAVGNDATCRAQGFFVQLGDSEFLSPFFGAFWWSARGII